MRLDLGERRPGNEPPPKQEWSRLSCRCVVLFTLGDGIRYVDTGRYDYGRRMWVEDDTVMRVRWDVVEWWPLPDTKTLMEEPQ